jgi:hypothetical protein
MLKVQDLACSRIFAYPRAKEIDGRGGKRSGLLVEKPSAWMVSREEREYAMAQRIITLSSFAQQSFTSQSVPSQK